MLLVYKIIKYSFLKNFTYRTASAINILCSFLFVFIQISIWKALLGSNTVNGISYMDMLTFLILNTLVYPFINDYTSNMDQYVTQQFRSGDICNEFIRPVSFRFLVFSQSIGENLYSLLTTSIPVALIVIVLFNINLPNDITVFVFYLIAQAFGLVITMLISYNTALFVFWFQGEDYTRFFVHTLYVLFAGSFVPLWFYPQWLSNIAAVLPYRLIVFEPISIYLGKTSAYGTIILYDVIWITILWVSERIIWKSVQKIVTIHGG